MKLKYQSFRHLINQVKEEFKTRSVRVAPSHWQGVKVEGRPDMETMEILNHSSTIDLGGYLFLDQLKADLNPDLPWADDHFEERVCGYPLNPGTQWAKWRLNASGSLDPDGRFNHNYMERMWPKYARMVPPSTVAHEHPLPTVPHKGILYEYGDLNDLVNLLHREPLTRQAFLPMFFPEDTGAVHRGRAPCSLGWQFIVRDDRLHCIYYLRSCDFINHWRNDLYFAVRLMMWIHERLCEKSDDWQGVDLGTLTTHITSFHCFMAQYCRMDEFI